MLRSCLSPPPLAVNLFFCPVVRGVFDAMPMWVWPGWCAKEGMTTLLFLAPATEHWTIGRGSLSGCATTSAIRVPRIPHTSTMARSGESFCLGRVFGFILHQQGRASGCCGPEPHSLLALGAKKQATGKRQTSCAFCSSGGAQIGLRARPAECLAFWATSGVHRPIFHRMTTCQWCRQDLLVLGAPLEQHLAPIAKMKDVLAAAASIRPHWSEVAQIVRRV